MSLKAFNVEARVMRELAPGDTEKFYRLLTEAEEKLLEAGRWSWVRSPQVITTIDGILTLPPEFESIVGARIGCGATSVFWQEIEYLEQSPCMCVQGCTSQLIDRGMVNNLRTYQLTRYEDTPQNPSQEVTLSLLLRYAPVEYSRPSQDMLCQSLPALKQAMYAVNYENQNDLERSNGYTSMAIATLDRQESAYRGTAKKIFQPSLFGPVKRRSRMNFP